ncbi:hypothetical protein M446_3784 [Methylobacterium sp. 4-46]|uniref:hypothetical protein n=1 Tax=unclassified Methylobacterium TaxID=2615210 RepID=UPI000165C981|nr:MULTISPECIES: hypothetical protein [Methylobacterium]ACA18162.1 hypothetical protein M446_3784 [Methylobacterium sp. 4-46]WFT77460.1 hypothetical protein QA634_19185 [Methylobacterium nodulans]
MPNRSYIVRKTHDGWSVHAAKTNEPVRLNGREQTGMSREAAAELANSLEMLAVVQEFRDERPVTNPYTLH